MWDLNDTWLFNKPSKHTPLKCSATEERIDSFFRAVTAPSYVPGSAAAFFAMLIGGAYAEVIIERRR